MKYLIVAFKSRYNLQNFANSLRLVGITVSIINTPRSISISCGLSARLDYRYLNTVTNVLSKMNSETLIGIFVVTSNGAYEQVEKVY